MSCGSHNEMNAYIQTVQSGIKTLPWPKQIEKLLGESDHFITHYGFDADPKEWNTEVFFGGRYRLTLQVDVEIDYKNHLIKTNVSAPKFYLFEAGAIRRNAKRDVEGVDISGQWIFDQTQWNKLVEAKGDWSVLGIPVKTNSPLPGFEEHVNRARAPRVRIPH